jgi:hypothetical protein
LTAESGGRQVLQRTDRHGERAAATHGIVGLRGCPVEGDLHVDIVGGRQPGGHLGGNPDAVGGKLHPDVLLGRVVDELPEVRSHGRLTAADVDVEHLHRLELVDDGLTLLGAQLARIPAAR